MKCLTKEDHGNQAVGFHNLYNAIQLPWTSRTSRIIRKS